MVTIDAPKNLTVSQFVANIARLVLTYGLDMPTFEIRPARMAKVFSISERHCRRLIAGAIAEGLLTRTEQRDPQGRLSYGYAIRDAVKPSYFEPDAYYGEFGGEADDEGVPAAQWEAFLDREVSYWSMRGEANANAC